MKKNFPLLITLGVFTLLLVSSAEAIKACRSGISLCVETIIPSLFPFFVFSILLSKLGLPSLVGKLLAPAATRIYGISGAGASALVIGLLGGYPLGAAYIADMARGGSITPAEGERLLGFCNNSGPAFIIGAVGLGVFGSVKAGITLYCIHISSALITGLFFKSKNYNHELQPVLLESVSPSAAFSQAVRQAVGSLAGVCGFIIFFTVLMALWDFGGTLSVLCGFMSSHLGWELHLSRALLCGLFELGSAAGTMRGMALSPYSFTLAAFLLGWGGLCVHMQTASVISSSNIKGTLHLAGRLITASFAAMTAYAVYSVIF